MIKVWDPLLRLFHWSLVAAIGFAWITAEGSETWHEWIGYVALGLIGFRLVWGLIGGRYARFTQFIRGPHKVIEYTKDMLNQREKRYIGHNPLGAMMVIALLATTAATGATGWLMADPGRVAMLPENPALVAPAFPSAVSDEHGRGAGTQNSLKEIHEAFANLLLLLIVLHVAGVIYASRRHKENLARAMIVGTKSAAVADDVS